MATVDWTICSSDALIPISGRSASSSCRARNREKLAPKASHRTQLDGQHREIVDKRLARCMRVAFTTELVQAEGGCVGEIEGDASSAIRAVVNSSSDMRQLVGKPR